MSKDVMADLKRDHITKLLSKGIRIDGRKFEEMRPLTVEKSYIQSAEGSARVRLGDTDVIVGVKMVVGQPFPDTPDKGVLTTNAELKPLASETFESGPPGKAAIELARVVDRGIREGQAVDMEKLCIEAEKEVWIMFIDIHTIDYDGNLFDAANVAAIAALKDAVVPAKRADKGEDFPLPVAHEPISVTAVKIDGHILADPTYDEEVVADARLTVAINEKGNICAMQKGGEGSFSVDEVLKIVDLSRRLGAEMRSKI
ncbi:MAG: exosome complex protein Rrp42 [Methanobacteriota archaeon]|nr:MAG: exosome complex protein Rrp42 [Euryarchaeota archaeon]